MPHAAMANATKRQISACKMIERVIDADTACNDLRKHGLDFSCVVVEAIKRQRPLMIEKIINFLNK